LIIIATWANCVSAFVSTEGVSKTFNATEAMRTLFEVTNDSTEVTVLTTPPGRLYQSAGIKILTPGYELVGTTPSSNGYSIFPVSNTLPATFTVSAPGTIDISLCLNGTGPRYSCETHRVAIQQQLFPTISSVGVVSQTVIGQSLIPGLGSLSSILIHVYLFNTLPGGGCDTTLSVADTANQGMTLTDTSIVTAIPPFSLAACMAFCNNSIPAGPYPGQSGICTNVVLITN
jgi:hypothetical protein